MKIGKRDFNPKLGNLTEANFKGFWEGGNYEEETGVTAENAQKKLLMKPKPKKK